MQLVICHDNYECLNYKHCWKKYPEFDSLSPPSFVCSEIEVVEFCQCAFRSSGLNTVITPAFSSSFSLNINRQNTSSVSRKDRKFFEKVSESVSQWTCCMEMAVFFSFCRTPRLLISSNLMYPLPVLKIIMLNLLPLSSIIELKI